MNDKINIRVPDGKSGDWSVETFNVSEEEAKAFNLRCAISFGERGRDIYPGEYKKLLRGNVVVMSNTPAEIQDHNAFFWECESLHEGRVLINGLGLGVALEKILQFDGVKHITVVEQSLDVIMLVAPTYKNNPRITIVHVSAFDYQLSKGEKYDVVWHDIWDNICSDNIPEMTKLHRKYGRRAKWQGSWCRELCELGI